MKKKSKKTWLWEFSKKIIVLVSVLYIISTIYVMVIICLQGQGLDAFIEASADVFKSCTVSYAIKAAFENVNKIKKGEPDDGLVDG